MHIVQITNDFPPMIGGMAVHAWELSKALANLGHRVSVITASRGNLSERRLVLPSKEITNGFEIFHLGQIPIRKRTLLLWQTRQYLRRIEPNPDTIIHLHELGKPRLMRRLSSLPMVWTNHSSDFLRIYDDVNERPNLFQDHADAEMITAPSKELAEKAVCVGHPSDLVRYIPNGVDTERFSPPVATYPNAVETSIGDKALSAKEGKCVIVCARRFAPKNGVHVLIDALERMHKDVLQNIIVLFIGSGSIGFDDYREKLVSRLNNLKQKCKCIIFSRIENRLMPEIYRYSDIAVLPSLQEATSIAGLEAMASGLPLLGTEVGGIPEIIINGKTGLLCPPSDADKLSTALSSLIKNVNLRKTLGQNARRHVEKNFSWKNIAAQFIEVYATAIDLRSQKIQRGKGAKTFR